MRVITGSARGKRLKTVEGLEVRPTTDMVKESVFNIIQFEVPGARVLDLFCGSGQMGIEALSRGADFGVFVDSSLISQQCAKENLISTGLFTQSRVVAMDAKQFLSSSKDTFDLAFLDPPYHQGLLEELLPLLAKKMNPTGTILCEHGKEDPVPETAGDIPRFRQYRYGKIMITTYRRPQEEE